LSSSHVSLETDAKSAPSVSVSVDEALVIVMLEVFHRIDVVAVVDKMLAVKNHRSCSRLEEPSCLEPDQLTAGLGT
jgi:hypothetical protein